ncbi:hypothetical protein [Cryobacterium zhongshanensis]|uniref:Uncharacterized protein n=1 Tax=Cryobacterium zhongshanensis TaxID=2928153 RepID=A0AA41UIL9_9MICO|nr:hypothetical protein [Cryobacterium zhongshanensis]MCI4659679.1 hypothetical protein [Cryobacterium zhongshanensis]
MRNTEQTLGTAIAELHCLSTDRPAELAELTALSTAAECINQLLSSCVTELRTDPQITHSWPAIAYALGSPSVNATRQKYGTNIAGTGAEHPVHGNGNVRAFWNAFADRFTWNFLPVDFVHALYVHWMSTTFPEEVPLGRAAFTGRLKRPATAAASGGWSYTRLRPAALLGDAEPLVDLVPQWSITSLKKAQYGFRRNQPVSRPTRSSVIEHKELAR